MLFLTKHTECTDIPRQRPFAFRSRLRFTKHTKIPVSVHQHLDHGCAWRLPHLFEFRSSKRSAVGFRLKLISKDLEQTQRTHGKVKPRQVTTRWGELAPVVPPGSTAHDQGSVSRGLPAAATKACA